MNACANYVLIFAETFLRIRWQYSYFILMFFHFILAFSSASKKEKQKSHNIIFRDKMCVCVLFTTCNCQVKWKSTLSLWADYRIANHVYQMKNKTSVTRRFISTEIFREEKSYYRKDNFILAIKLSALGLEMLENEKTPKLVTYFYSMYHFAELLKTNLRSLWKSRV